MQRADVRMEICQILPLDCLISIFSLLQDEDLIKASRVCKEWHHAAETPWLWRRMCLQKWSFCNVSQLLSNTGTHSWKDYYLRRTHLEVKMKSGRSCADYTCKSLRGHKGRVVGFAYLVGNDACSDVWKSTAVVCSASTDGTVKAWDIQKGVNLWSSPAQSPLQDIVVDPVQSIAVTSDITGTIKTWKGSTGEELASFESGFSKTTLLLVSKNCSSFLMVGTILGSLVVLTCPTLSEVSRHVVCDSFSLNLLLSSIDKKWIFSASKENIDLSPKVFYSESVCDPLEDEDTVCQSLPVTGCCAAVFLPSQPARVAVIHKDGLVNNTLSVFDLNIKESKNKKEPQAQQVASFQVEMSHHSDVILEARGSNTLLLTDGNHLKVYTLKGELVASFEDHIQPITSLCVDSFRVVTASRDLSLRVLTWRNDKDHGLMLESQYHLLGGSYTMSSRGFTNVSCDYSSIVASVESVDGKDVLKAYTFDF